MWIDTAVVDAKPVIILGVALAGITCFISKPTTELAGIDTAGTIVTPSKAIVAVEADVAALDNTMFDTTVVVVVVGTVYRVVLDVAAAVRAIALVVVAISYYLSLLECFHKKQS
jgi:hypothetical protein